MTLRHVTGSEALQRELERLQLREVPRAAAAGTVDGVEILAEAIRGRAPIGRTGSVQNAVGQRLVSGSRAGLVEGKAGLNVAKRGGGHAHLVALGTERRFTKRGGDRGVMPGNDFVNQAAAVVQGRAAQAVLDRTYQIFKAG